jgi:hypothetical protein
MTTTIAEGAVGKIRRNPDVVCGGHILKTVRASFFSSRVISSNAFKARLLRGSLGRNGISRMGPQGRDVTSAGREDGTETLEGVKREIVIVDRLTC